MVVTGEYGTGKSKFFENVFHIFSDSARESSVYPLSIDLRKCWGLKDRFEIIRRHLTEHDLLEAEAAFIRAYNAGYLLIMLDGFDELSAQAWSDDPANLRNLRYDALSGARDLISNQKGALIVCGRDNYFDSESEMLTSLGLDAGSTIIVRTKDEFSVEEAQKFLDNHKFDGDLPTWLPRKPLTCEFFVAAFAGSSANVLEAENPTQFWEVYFQAVCERDARINPGFDASAIEKILISVSAITRNKPGNFGPISLSEMRAAFERAVGYTPVETAGVLLQRMAGLGRVSSDSEDRRFVDTYLLDGLRAIQVVDFIRNNDTGHYLDEDWINPLGPDGVLLAAQRLALYNLTDEAIRFTHTAARRKNHTLIGDIVSAVLMAGADEADFGGLQVVAAHIGVLDAGEIILRNIKISDSVISSMNLPVADPQAVAIDNCIISELTGVTTESGTPSWITNCEIGQFTSIATTSRIKEAAISPEHKVLVAILHKTFFQPGSARKEEALFRGLGKLAKPRIVNLIVKKLIAEGLMKEAKGDTGKIYSPTRSETKRVSKMLAQLNVSKDPIWFYVTELAKE